MYGPIDKAPYYEALCWFIKKYSDKKLPDCTTIVCYSAFSLGQITVWAGTPDGNDYWHTLANIETGKYMRKSHNTLASMIKDYERYIGNFSPQLELEL